MMKKRNKTNWILFIAILLFVSCESTHSPKPRGYFRIDLPEHNYIKFDSVFPFTFEYPDYSHFEPDYHSPNEKYFVNLVSDRFKASLHFSYKKVNGNLATYLEDSHKLVSRLIPKADAINDSIIINRDKRVFGLSYRILGNGAASPYQFFLTDSANHFVRASLYFNVIPNNDSLEPVINYMISDINHIISTFEWKN